MQHLIIALCIIEYKSLFFTKRLNQCFQKRFFRKVYLHMQTMWDVSMQKACVVTFSTYEGWDVLGC